MCIILEAVIKLTPKNIELTKQDSPGLTESSGESFSEGHRRISTSPHDSFPLLYYQQRTISHSNHSSNSDLKLPHVMTTIPTLNISEYVINLLHIMRGGTNQGWLQQHTFAQFQWLKQLLPLVFDAASLHTASIQCVVAELRRLGHVALSHLCSRSRAQLMSVPLWARRPKCQKKAILLRYRTGFSMPWVWTGSPQILVFPICSNSHQ